MKLLRYGPAGAGKARPPRFERRDPRSVRHRPRYRGRGAAAGSLAIGCASSIRRRCRVVNGTPRIGPCVGQVGKFICVGLNYSDHAAESGMAVPNEPILFMKATSCIVGPDDDIVLPRGSQKTDWEVELGVVIGKPAKYVSEADALAHVAGYCVVHDISERAYQLEGTGQWVKGKSADTFGPIGPWLVTADEVAGSGEPETLARRRRHAPPGRLDEDADLRRPVPGQLHQPVHEPAVGRHDYHRHAARRRPRPETARVPASRQRSAARSRRSGRAAPAGRQLRAGWPLTER